MEQQSVNQRLNLLVETFEKGKKASFARKAGISPQGAQELLAGRKGDPSFKVLVKILESYPQVRVEWLVLGNGPMLKDEPIPDISETKKHDMLHRLGNQYLYAGAELYRWNTIGNYVKRIDSILGEEELIMAKQANTLLKEQGVLSKKESAVNYESKLADLKKEMGNILSIAINFSSKEEKRVYNKMLKIKDKQAKVIDGTDSDIDIPEDEEGGLRTLIF